MKKLWIYSLATIGILLMLASSCKKDDNTGVAPYGGGRITDIDGNVYTTVTIGTQTWMVQNLKVTKYRDGSSITNVTDNTQWKNLTEGAYCSYSNNNSNAAVYGYLYNGFAVNDSRNIAPLGWHVPTDADWSTLIDYLGGESFAGSTMKETGTTHWLKPNTSANNNSSFTALPGGSRNANGFFLEMATIGYWWSSTLNTQDAYFRTLIYNDVYVGKDLSYLKAGFSVRCVRD